ncbi:lysophospholipid acyltransferase family protein [Streptomyces sp. NPDC051219]|uniref:lysophospholipid acyltransferase family protein n=1 Tax=Streptomyces sp. NPDC051219 TaxID=3155283 RepID=UPI00342562FD
MSAWLPSAPCSPRVCAQHRGPSAGVPRAVARLLAGVTLVLAGVLLCPAVRGLPAAHRDRLTRTWAQAVVRAFGVRIRVLGHPAHRAGTGMLVVSNHISWLDIPLIAAVQPGRMLAKSEIGRWPVLGPVAARGGTLFVERDRLRALPATVARMAGALRAGSRVVVFPEGSTWCGRQQGRFRPAAFQAALDAGVPVQPVRISYRLAGGGRATAAAFVGDDSLPASLWRVAAAGGLVAEITLLPRIPVGRHPDRRALARAAQTAVASDSANLPASSVHHWVSSRPARASSLRTPS